jgi:hypothetical protein
MNEAPSVTAWPSLSRSIAPDSRAPNTGSELLSA